MSVSQATLTDRVRDLLDEPGWDDPLSTTISSTSTTTMVVADTTLYDVGGVIEEQGSGEQMYITALATATNLTVQRGYNGTTKSNSIPSGTLLRTNPRFTMKKIVNAGPYIFGQLWPYAYTTADATVTPTSGTYWYDLNDADMALISVRQIDSSGKHLFTYGERGSRLPVGFSKNVPTSLCASGTGVYFPRPFASTSTNITVRTARQYASVSDLSTDDLSVETVATGIASRLAMLKEVARDSYEDTGMGDASVPPGARTRVGRDLWSQFIYLRGMLHEQCRRNRPLIGAFHGGSVTSTGSRGLW